MDDGGYVFPQLRDSNGKWSGDYGYGGLTRREWFATFAPEPDNVEITLMYASDRRRNPHNDSYKPKPRTKNEIIADYKFAYADAMIAASKKEKL